MGFQAHKDWDDEPLIPIEKRRHVALTETQYKAVQDSILGNIHLGDDRDAILKAFDLTGDDSLFCHWHSSGCECGGCGYARRIKALCEKLEKGA